ncbi:hypothetical protein AMELA_G00030360 [Ameiurus melas]|uniref:Secreted protein n=1 Tax=Ameiurus melas TaxID=219545 RepID=A0A7J6B8X2_AMEME|nr:hypothetical protein AMELA_G00030360 [Ameiurus melas]
MKSVILYFTEFYIRLLLAHVSLTAVHTPNKTIQTSLINLASFLVLFMNHEPIQSNESIQFRKKLVQRRSITRCSVSALSLSLSLSLSRFISVSVQFFSGCSFPL